MIIKKEDSMEKLKEIILKEKKIIREISSLSDNLERLDEKEKSIVFSQINTLKNSLKETNNSILEILGNISLVRPLHSEKTTIVSPSQQIQPKEISKSQEKFLKNKNLKLPFNLLGVLGKSDLSKLEKETIKRLKRKRKIISRKKIKKPSKYIQTANKLFSNFSKSLLKKTMFKTLERNLIKTNLQFVATSYISVMLLSTLLSIFAGIFIFLFLLFFNIGPDLPIITRITESIGIRFLKIFWILFVIPIGTFLFMHFYPSLEKKSLGSKINQELPFATINMSAISGSMIEPSKIFSIIISTKEYPNLEREFIKLINEINVYGYDLVTALKNIASNSPSKRLTELFIGLATTINSGGDLPDFFDKRAQTLLFEHRIEREKYTKFSETFMDIYISAVIAAPMILMLLLMMIKISGLGIPLSASMISLVMILAVSLLNVVFLVFLHLKQPID